MSSLVFRSLFLVCTAAVALPILASEKPEAKTAARKRPKRVYSVAPATSQECPTEDIVSNSAAGAALRVSIDPVTGKLRELSPEEARELASAGASLARAPEQFEAVVHSNGMVSVDLHDAFMQDLVLQKNPDGSMTMECNPHVDIPKARPSAPPPAPSRAPLEEK